MPLIELDGTPERLLCNPVIAAIQRQQSSQIVRPRHEWILLECASANISRRAAIATFERAEAAFYEGLDVATRL